MSQRRPVAEYDVDRLRRDITERGWLPVDLARAADVNPSTVMRFFDGEFQTARTAQKLARALGYSIRRYLRPAPASAAK